MGEGSGDAKNELLGLDDPAGVAASDLSAESGINPVQHPTIVPKFDPAQYAEESEIRERMPTLTDEAALEMARQQSLPTRAPPPLPPIRRSMSTMPPAPGPNMRDSQVEIDTGEEDLDALGSDEQIAILSARLSPLTRVPALARPMTELGSLLEDPKTAYVLGFVDGILPLETIIDVTGLPELETLRVLDRMVSHSVVVFRSFR